MVVSMSPLGIKKSQLGCLRGSMSCVAVVRSTGRDEIHIKAHVKTYPSNIRAAKRRGGFWRADDNRDVWQVAGAHPVRGSRARRSHNSPTLMYRGSMKSVYAGWTGQGDWKGGKSREQDQIGKFHWRCFLCESAAARHQQSLSGPRTGFPFPLCSLPHSEHCGEAPCAHRRSHSHAQHIFAAMSLSYVLALPSSPPLGNNACPIPNTDNSLDAVCDRCHGKP